MLQSAIGTLDDPSAIAPITKQSAIKSRVPWFNAMHKLPEERMEDYRTPQEIKMLKSLQHPDYDT
jgi:hypothetical protein